MSAEKLMIVDDEKNMRELLRDFFVDEGYNVEMAEDGGQALEKLDEGFDMVISDNRMPVLHGMDLLVEIKKNFPDMPVIIITAYSTPTLSVEAYKRGASAYLPKPFNPEDLLQKVKEIIRLNRMSHRKSEVEEQSRRY